MSRTPRSVLDDLHHHLVDVFGGQPGVISMTRGECQALTNDQFAYYLEHDDWGTRLLFVAEAIRRLQANLRDESTDWVAQQLAWILVSQEQELREDVDVRNALMWCMLRRCFS